MPSERNIVILGASFSGIQAAQYITTHLLPALNAHHSATAKYRVYVINPSLDFYFRLASPRAATSTTLLPAEKIFVPLSTLFDKLPKDDFTFIQGSAEGLDANARTVTFKRVGGKEKQETLHYHALIMATGSRTYHPAYSHYSTEVTQAAIKTMNNQVLTAKNIVVVGGGPTGIESAAEIGEFLNGRPGWFFNSPRKVPVTIITSADRLFPTLRPAIGKLAEQKLKSLGVDVLYNSRVDGTEKGGNGQTIVTLANGQKLETDLYIPAHGVLPNSSYVPENLLNESKYVITNPTTLRVDIAGPRVYALGDISSASRNTAIDINNMFPVLMINIKRDLFAFDVKNPEMKAPGKDREYVEDKRETLAATIGTQGGVGSAFGWMLPNWVVWLFKSRDMMVGAGIGSLLEGKNISKEVAWKSEEVIVL